MNHDLVNIIEIELVFLIGIDVYVFSLKFGWMCIENTLLLLYNMINRKVMQRTEFESK